jgi:SAM-dependent methyltransferase
MDRVQKLLSGIDRSMKILEIGPSFNPVAPKSQGWNSWSVDHADQGELKEKYRAHASVDESQIEAVDFIWHNGDLDQAIPIEHHNTFGACIASHVIEHFTNPIGFFRSMSRLIAPQGIISLAVPDKRFCFDYFKPLSLTGDLLSADEQSRKRHTKCTAFNEVAYSVFSDNVGAWSQHPIESISFVYSIKRAKKAFDAAEEGEFAPYVDYHGWFYTPASFTLIILELNYLDVIDWTIDCHFPTVGCEFFVTLKKGKTAYASESDFDDQRLNLLKNVLDEVKTQREYLIEPDCDDNQAARSADSGRQPPPYAGPDVWESADRHDGRRIHPVGNPHFRFGNVGGVGKRLLKMMRAGRK